MLLAVDVGNTQTHIGMFSGDELLEHWRFATRRDATGDEVATLLVSLLALRDRRLEDVDGAIVSSVVPQLAHEYEQVSERYFAGTLMVVGPGVRTGIPIRTENPHEVGADRLVNAVAAYDRVGGACVVVDFGTTINYDVVSDDGELLGAIFTPGVEISIAALAQRAARLPNVDIEPPRELIGRSTVTAIQSGVVYGFAGQVDGIVGRLREELGDGITAIATGGLASAIAPFCDQIDETDDLLTLTGLRLVWERNRG
jgi:type III pantothenate kinase